MKHEKARVKSISEAFSMQPAVFDVGKPCYGEILDHIDRVQVEEYEYAYIAYNSKGEPLFRYLEKSVNVHYYT